LDKALLLAGLGETPLAVEVEPVPFDAKRARRFCVDAHLSKTRALLEEEQHFERRVSRRQMGRTTRPPRRSGSGAWRWVVHDEASDLIRDFIARERDGRG
jgi:hypothetical protein